jgi:non-specific serine/threonine protein kinase
MESRVEIPNNSDAFRRHKRSRVIKALRSSQEAMSSQPKTGSEATPGAGPGSLWRFANLEFDDASLLLRIDGQTVDLERRPLELLHLLLQHAGEVVTKDEILEAVWPGRIVSDAALTKCVARLRQAIGDTEQTLIRTIYGFGYRLAVPVSIEVLQTGSALAASPDTFDFKPGDPIPHRPAWVFVRRIGVGGYGDVWLGEHGKTREQRVFKFGKDGVQLAALKREITLFRVLNDSLGPREDFVRILEWNLVEPPYFIEVDYSQEGNLEEWVARQGGFAAVEAATRIDLIAQIAEALAAAHSVGVLHKDVKPSNVLIYRDAFDRLRIQLSDFGSGRVFDGDRLRRLGITQMGFTQVIAPNDSTSGTPLYSAPELLAGQPPTVQADIYALGVMLFQMLVGDFRRPLAPGWEQRIDDVLLREDIAAAAAGDPAERLSDAAQLVQRLRTLDARRSERERERHQQAQAELTQRALERVRARRGLWQALAASLLVGLAFSLWFAVSAERSRRQAESETEKARAVTAFLTDDILAAANPMVVGTRDVQMRQVLDKAAATLDQRFAAEPLVLAELQRSIGAGYAAVLDYDKAEPLLLSAEKGLSAQLGNAAQDTQESRLALRDMYLDNNDEAKLLAVSLRIDAAEKAAGNPNPGMGYEARAMLAAVPCAQKRPVFWLGNCAPVVQPILDEARARLGPEDRTSLRLEMYVGVYLNQAEMTPQAEPLLRHACAGLERIYGPQHPRLMECQNHLAWALDKNGKTAEALPLSENTAKVLMQALGPDNPLTVEYRMSSARVLAHAGRFDEALSIAREIFEARRKAGGDDEGHTVRAGMVYGRMLVDAGRPREALDYEQRALSHAEAAFGADHPSTINIRNFLGLACFHAGDHARAELLLRQNLQYARARFKDREWFLALVETSLAEALAAQGHADEARKLVNEAIGLLTEQLGADNPNTRHAAEVLSHFDAAA